MLLQVRDPVDVSEMIEEESVYCDEDEMVMLLRVAEPMLLSVISGGD